MKLALKTETDALSDQLPLFPGEAWPDQPALVHHVKEYVHTGKIAMGNQQLVESIILGLQLGYSQRAIADAYKVSRNTIGAVVVCLEECGKLEPLKRRVTQRFLELANLALDEFGDMLRRGLVEPKVLAFAAPKFFEAYSLGMGQATELSANIGGGAPDRAAAIDWWARLKRAKESIEIDAKVIPGGDLAGGPLDCPSSVAPGQVPPAQEHAQRDTGLDTTAPTADAADQVLLLGPAPSAAAPPPAAAQEGGGACAAQPTTGAHMSTAANFGPV